MNTYLDCSSISPQRLLTRPNFEIHHTSTYLHCSISIKRHHSCDGTRHNAQIKKDNKRIPPPPPPTKESLNATLTFTVGAYMSTCTAYCIHVLLTVLDIIMSHHILWKKSEAFCSSLSVHVLLSYSRSTFKLAVSSFRPKEFSARTQYSPLSSILMRLILSSYSLPMYFCMYL